MPTYALDYRLFGDERVAEETMKIARWLADSLGRGSSDGFVTSGFLAPAISFDVTRGGGPLEELVKKWWTPIAAYQQKEPYCTAKSDFASMRWDEFLQLFYFLRASSDIGYTETSPPK